MVGMGEKGWIRNVNENMPFSSKNVNRRLSTTSKHYNRLRPIPIWQLHSNSFDGIHPIPPKCPWQKSLPKHWSLCLMAS